MRRAPPLLTGHLVLLVQRGNNWVRQVGQPVRDAERDASVLQVSLCIYILTLLEQQKLKRRKKKKCPRKWINSHFRKSNEKNQSVVRHHWFGSPAHIISRVWDSVSIFMILSVCVLSQSGSSGPGLPCARGSFCPAGTLEEVTCPPGTFTPHQGAISGFTCLTSVLIQ